MNNRLVDRFIKDIFYKSYGPNDISYLADFDNIIYNIIRFS